MLSEALLTEEVVEEERSELEREEELTQALVEELEREAMPTQQELWHSNWMADFTYHVELR